MTETKTAPHHILEGIGSIASLDDLPRAKLSDVELHAPDYTLDEARKIFHEWGCLLVRGLLADMAPAIVEDTHEMARQVKESNYTRTGNALVMPGDKTSNEKQIMLFCPVYRHSAAHFRAATDDRVLDILEACVGPNIEMYGGGMCMYKEPGGGMEKALHQDAPYFYHRDHTFCSVFLHLCETNEENGHLHCIPGSYKMGLLEHVDSFSHLALPKDKYPLECATPISAKMGDCLFFNYLTIHGSGNNNSDEPRPALVMQYRSADDDKIWKGAGRVEDIGQPEEDKHDATTVVRGRRIKF